MASLTTICAIPELLYEILEWQTPDDTFSLLLTSKAFLPLCSKYLWMNLRLYSTEGTKSYANTGICKRIVKTLERHGVDGCGVKHTRALRLHRHSLMIDSEFISCGLGKKFGALLAEGRLDLDCVEFTYRDPRYLWSHCGTSPGSLAFLGHIAEHALKKGTGRFSQIVTTDLTPSILQDLRVEGITDLRLEINWNIGLERVAGTKGDENGLFDSGPEDSDADAGVDGESDPESESVLDRDRTSDADDSYNLDNWSYGDQLYEDRSQWNKDLADALTEILKKASKLRHFSVSTVANSGGRYRDLKPLKHLSVLRDTIRNMQALRTLEIIGKFFHPSFFVAPPPSAREITYDGLLSTKWFRKFSKYPFAGVKHLRIMLREDAPRTRWLKKDFSSDRQLIEDVEVRGLESCELYGVEGVVLGMESAILRRNKGLAGSSKVRLSWAVGKVLKGAAIGKLMDASVEYLGSVESRYVRDNIGGGGTERNGDVNVIKTVQDCLRAMPKCLETVKAHKVTRDRAQEISWECAHEIQDLISAVESRFILEYTQKLLHQGTVDRAGGKGVDINAATRDYLEMMLKAIGKTEAWAANQAEAEEFVGKCRDRVKEEIDAFTEYWAEKRVVDLTIQTESQEELMERFVSECAEELGSRQFFSAI